MSFPEDVRLQLLGQDDTGSLSDAYINLHKTDATSFTGISSENVSLRYYVCYLIALNWESIGALESREGVKYRVPNPDKYLGLYEKSIINGSTSGDSYGSKVSTNEGNIVDDNGLLIKGDFDETF